MQRAHIVAAVRTPVAKRGGGLSGVHPVDLGAFVLEELVRRSGVDASRIDDVIFGCVDQVGAQAMNIARNCWLAAGLPESVPAVTVDRQCGSSQQALQFASQAIRAGDADLIVVGGVEVMSSVPILAAITVGEAAGMGNPWQSPRWLNRFGSQEVSQFRGAELVAEHWKITREDCDEFALESHRRAAAAWDEGRFDREVVPAYGVTADEGIRRDTSLEKLAGLKTLRPGGVVTAGSSSQVSDASAAMLVASERALDEFGMTSRAVIRTSVAVGSDPIRMLDGPIPATRLALERSGLTLGDIDLFEVNEAFAPVVLAWARELGVDLAHVNVNGGAIAIGHPLGASGARIATTLLHEMERSDARRGLMSMCEGAGTANATILERAA